MKIKKIAIMLAVIMFVMTVIMSGCGDTKQGKSLEEQIIGSWDEEDSIGYGFFFHLNFYDDNTVDWNSSKAENFASWTIVNGDILKFTYNDTLNSDYSGIDKWTITIDGDIMILTNDDGGMAQYSRK